jgi:hypothetical protein
MKNRNIDVYLTPLLEELQLLWKGGLCLGCDKAKGVVKVQIARPTYVGKS